MKGEEVVDWVNIIRRCKVLVTDSFHATCFGIIFRKPIIYLNIESRGGDRIPSLSRMLAVSIPIFSEDELLNHHDDTLSRLVALRDTPIDYTTAEPVLAAQVEATRKYLQQALEAPAPPGGSQISVDPEVIRAERDACHRAFRKAIFRLIPQYIGHCISGIFNHKKLAKAKWEKQKLRILWRKLTYY